MVNCHVSVVCGTTLRNRRPPITVTRTARARTIAIGALGLCMVQACLRDPDPQVRELVCSEGAGAGGIGSSTDGGGTYTTGAAGGGAIAGNAGRGGTDGIPIVGGGGSGTGGTDCDSAPAPLYAAKGFLVDNFDAHTLDDSDTCLSNALPPATSPSALSNLFGYCSTCFAYGGGQIETALANQADALRGAGKALRLTYDVNQGFAGYVQWFTRNTVCGGDCGALGVASHCGDLSAIAGSCAGFDLERLNFRYLTFWIRFDADGSTAPGDVEVALKDVCDQQTDPKVLAYATGTRDAVAGAWTKIKIGLDTLRTNWQKPVDTSQLREVSFTFANAAKYPRHGTIYLDDLAFERD